MWSWMSYFTSAVLIVLLSITDNNEERQTEGNSQHMPDPMIKLPCLWVTSALCTLSLVVRYIIRHSNVNHCHPPNQESLPRKETVYGSSTYVYTGGSPGVDRPWSENLSTTGLFGWCLPTPPPDLGRELGRETGERGEHVPLLVAGGPKYI